MMRSKGCGSGLILEPREQFLILEGQGLGESRHFGLGFSFFSAVFCLLLFRRANRTAVGQSDLWANTGPELHATFVLHPSKTSPFINSYDDQRGTMFVELLPLLAGRNIMVTAVLEDKKMLRVRFSAHGRTVAPATD